MKWFRKNPRQPTVIINGDGTLGVTNIEPGVWYTMSFKATHLPETGEVKVTKIKVDSIQIGVNQ